MDTPRFLDQTLFAELAGKAAANPRGRQHHNFHQMEDACHRMAVGLQPSTYIPPHRHLGDNKAETLLVDRKSTRLNSSHVEISYAVFCLNKNKRTTIRRHD